MGRLQTSLFSSHTNSYPYCTACCSPTFIPLAKPLFRPNDVSVNGRPESRIILRLSSLDLIDHQNIGVRAALCEHVRDARARQIGTIPIQHDCEDCRTSHHVVQVWTRPLRYREGLSLRDGTPIGRAGTDVRQRLDHQSLARR